MYITRREKKLGDIRKRPNVAGNGAKRPDPPTPHKLNAHNSCQNARKIRY